MKNIFDYNSDVEKTAYLNWMTRRHDHFYNMLYLAESYIESARILVEKCIEDNSDRIADRVIFSSLFCTNHALELYLKMLIWELNNLLEITEKPGLNHNINQLYDTFLSKIKKYEHPSENFRVLMSEIKQIEEYIKEITEESKGEAQNKNNLFFTRYPFDTSYREYFYILENKNVVVDLEAFLQSILTIKDVCGRLGWYYIEAIEKKNNEKNNKNKEGNLWQD